MQLLSEWFLVIPPQRTDLKGTRAFPVRSPPQSSHQPEKTYRAQHAKGVHNVLETHELREGTPMGPKKHQLKATDIRGTETEQWPSQVSGRSIFQKNIHKNPRESRRCSVANLRTTVPSSLQKLEVYDIINWFTTLYIYIYRWSYVSLETSGSLAFWVRCTVLLRQGPTTLVQLSRGEVLIWRWLTTHNYK